jgi:hypothetical protein
MEHVVWTVIDPSLTTSHTSPYRRGKEKGIGKGGRGAGGRWLAVAGLNSQENRTWGGGGATD